MERELNFRITYAPELDEGIRFFSSNDKQLRAALEADDKFQRRFDSLYRRFCEVVDKLNAENKP